MTPDVRNAMAAYFRWRELIRGTTGDPPDTSDAFTAGYLAAVGALFPVMEAPTKPFDGTFPIPRLEKP